MFNFRSAITGALAFGAIAFAVPAQATIFVNANGAAANLVAGEVYQQAAGDGIFLSGSGPFSDVYSFTYAPPPGLSSLASTTNLLLSSNYFIDNFLFSWIGPAGSGVNQAGAGVLSSAPLILTIGGTYLFTLSGTPRSQGGQYTFSLITEEAPQVPLPAAVVLFGSGLAGLGLLARRRRNATTAA